MLADLTEELQSSGDSPCQQVAYIWIAPNELHQQSYFKMKNYFTETRLLKPVMYDEIDQSEGFIKPGEILFVNWESINKDKNVMVRDSEQNASLYEITRRTQEEQVLPIRRTGSLLWEGYHIVIYIGNWMVEKTSGRTYALPEVLVIDLLLLAPVLLRLADVVLVAELFHALNLGKE